MAITESDPTLRNGRTISKFENPRNDAFWVGILKGDFNLGLKQKTLSGFFSEVFQKSDQPLDQARIGLFLKTAVELNQDSKTPQVLKKELSGYLAGSLLNRVTVESARNRWDLENSQAALEAFCEFQTLEALYGDDTTNLKREIAEDIIYGREFDLRCGQEAQGVGINLSAQGTEVAQCTIRRALLDSTRYLGVNPYIWGYYRDRNLVMDRVAGYRGLMNPDQVMAELLQKEGAPRGAGLGLATFGGNLDRKGEWRVGLGEGQVAGHQNEAVGKAVQIRTQAIQKEGIVFDKPQRTNHFRDIKLTFPTDVMLLSFGDGAVANLPSAYAAAGTYNAPVIFLCQDNDIAIGTDSRETHPDRPRSQGGFPAGIPGITIKSIDYEKMIKATYFATLRAALDGGGTTLHVKTERIAPHSNSHGHNKIPQIGEATKSILLESANSTSNQVLITAIEQFIKSGLYVTKSDDRTIDIRNRIRNFMDQQPLDTKTLDALNTLLSTIIDPMEVVLKSLVDEGVVTKEELTEWQKDAYQESQQIADEVKTRPSPKPDEVVGKHIRIPDVIIPNPKVVAETTVTKTGAKAISDAILEAVALGDQGLYVAGIDAYTGFEVKTSGVFPKGGYFHEFDGVFEALAKYPGRFTNLPIHERAIIEQFMGAATQLSRLIEPDFYRHLALLDGDKDYPQTLANTIRRYIVNLAYGDYGLEAFAGWFKDAGIVQNTNGQYIRPVHTLMHQGMVASGGPWHSHCVEAIFHTLPEGLDLFTVSQPEDMYNLLKTQIHFGNNSSAILWDRAMWNVEQSWEQKTGFFELGRDRVVQEGEDLQIITWGPMRKFVQEAAKVFKERFGRDISVGILEKISWRPWVETDLRDFLSTGTGPILIVTEDTENRGLGEHVKSRLISSPTLKPYTLDRNRIPDAKGSLPLSHPFSSKDLMNTQRLTVEKLVPLFEQALLAAA